LFASEKTFGVSRMARVIQAVASFAACAQAAVTLTRFESHCPASVSSESLGGNLTLAAIRFFVALFPLVKPV
jgi:hypothetical protein